jgi:hypothetical protein
MRSRVIFALVFALALVIGFGAVNKTPLSALFSGSQPAIAASQVDAAATPAATPTSPTASIQAVVDRANQEQQDAFAQQNPSLMQDTATTDYYDQLVQTSQKMASGGVTAIKLLKLQWGAINLDSATTATATTTETWLTTYSDGTTEQNTDQNVYFRPAARLESIQWDGAFVHPVDRDRAGRLVGVVLVDQPGFLGPTRQPDQSVEQLVRLLGHRRNLHIGYGHVDGPSVRRVGQRRRQRDLGRHRRR